MTFDVVGATCVKFGLHAGTIKLTERIEAETVTDVITH
jgi:hypothetical protein